MQNAYPQQQRRMTGSSGMPIPQHAGNVPPRSSNMVGMPGSVLHQPQAQQYVTSPTTSHMQPHPGSYSRPSMQMSTNSDTPTQSQVGHGGGVDKVPTSQSPEIGNPPSPPLSQTIQNIVTTLTDKKDRERARAHELEVIRLKREESERVRWHQREMMRLKIQLIRAERNASGNAAMASSTPGAGPSHLGSGGVEDDLALAAGLGDDGMSLEGDGEGELDEDMFDPEPPSSRHPNHSHHHHHSSSGAQ